MLCFKWVEDGATAFDAGTMAVEDENVFSFKMSHKEGGYPFASVVLENPRAGLLHPARARYVWISYKDDVTLVVTPIFWGRVVGVPEQIEMENRVSLDFVGRPDDYEDQKRTLADTLKVFPYYDPVFIAEEQLDDPDMVLSARPAMWHVGRIDRLVTISDILSGEAGTLVLTDADIIANSLRMNYGDAVSRIEVEASVTWQQAASGIVDMSRKLMDAFAAVGAPSLRVSSYTGGGSQGLEATWPLYGTSMNGGWTVDRSEPRLTNKSIANSDYVQVEIDPTKAVPDFAIEPWWESSAEGYQFWYDKAYEKWLRDKLKEPDDPARFFRWDFAPLFTVRYDANRARKETIRFTLAADIQALLYNVDPDAKTETITLNSTQVGLPVDAGDLLPIGDVKRRSYFDTERGQRSIEYAISMARSRILFAARAVDMTVEIPWLLALPLSCRHDVLLSLDDIPGGSAGGKVLAYEIEYEDMQMRASVTFGCCIGLGNSLPAPADGEPIYVDEDYVEDEYQQYVGQSLQPIAGEVEYEVPVIVPNDDGFDFTNPTPESILADTAATALFTLTGQPADGQTVTIGPRAYTFRTALSVGPTVPDEILIGPDFEATARNMADALNRTEANEGTTFSTGTVANAQVSATVNTGIIRVTARVPGVAGNAIAVTDTAANASWDQSTLYNGDAGIQIDGSPNEQEDALDAVFGSYKQAEDALNEFATVVTVAVKPVTGGPYETTIDLVVSELMVPQTINLSAAPL